MASRQVRKLLQQQQVVLAQDPGVSGQESQGSPEEHQAPFNPFALLSDDDTADGAPDREDLEQGQEEDGDGGAALVELIPENDPAAAALAAPSPSQAAQRAASEMAVKKSKRKSGGKKGGNAAASSSRAAVAPPATTPGVPSPPDGDLDDIDRLVSELNLQTVGATQASAQELASGGAADGLRAATTTHSAPAGAAPTAQLLAVDPSALRGEDELRRIFGASVIAAVDREDAVGGGGGGGGARRRAGQTGVRGRQAPGGPAGLLRRARRGILATPREHWPAMDTGLSMEFTGLQGGRKVFRYVWSPGYRATQRAFLAAQASHDPNAVAAILATAPYHVDSLLAMYDLYRHMGENQYAEEVLLRALHALEAAWHPHFDVRSGDCSLDFGLPENRGMFLALFRHVQGLSRSGCHATALEVSKLLLALEPEDPLGVLCMMDYLAVRAGRYAYLQQLVAGWDPDAGLALRPNFAFTLPLALFKQRQQQDSAATGGPSTSTAPPAWAAPATQPSSPERMLTQAILMHPSVVPRLVAKLQEKGAGREASWSTLLGRKLFTAPHDAGSSALQHLGAIYVERSALLWRPAELMALLSSCATRAADLWEAGRIQRADGACGEDDRTDAEPRPADWVAARREAFPDDGGANAEFGHLRLADFSDNVNALPREEMGDALGPPPAAGAVRVEGQGGMMDEDEAAAIQALADAVAAMDAAAGRGAAGEQPNGRGRVGGGRLSDDELRAANPLVMLLRSMLPWVDAGQQPEYGSDDNDSQGEGPEGAMRDGPAH